MLVSPCLGGLLAVLYRHCHVLQLTRSFRYLGSVISVDMRIIITNSMANGTRRFRIRKGFPIILFLSRINPVLVLIPVSSRSILILFSHLRLGLPKGLFPVGLPVKILKALLLSSILATCPANFILLDLITIILGERYKL